MVAAAIPVRVAMSRTSQCSDQLDESSEVCQLCKLLTMELPRTVRKETFVQTAQSDLRAI